MWLWRGPRGHCLCSVPGPPGSAWPGRGRPEVREGPLTTWAEGPGEGSTGGQTGAGGWKRGGSGLSARWGDGCHDGRDGQQCCMAPRPSAQHSAGPTRNSGPAPRTRVLKCPSQVSPAHLALSHHYSESLCGHPLCGGCSLHCAGPRGVAATGRQGHGWTRSQTQRTYCVQALCWCCMCYRCLHTVPDSKPSPGGVSAQLLGVCFQRSACFSVLSCPHPHPHSGLKHGV